MVNSMISYGCHTKSVLAKGIIFVKYILAIFESFVVLSDACCEKVQNMRKCFMSGFSLFQNTIEHCNHLQVYVFVMHVFKNFLFSCALTSK